MMPRAAHATRATTATAVTLTLDRGLQVLRAFRADRAPLTNGELAERTGLPRSTISRLTATLIHEGYLRRVAGGPRLELATGVFSIGQAYLEANPLTRIAEPLMQQLADQVGAAVALAVPDHLDMLYIAHRHSTRVSTLQLGVGSLLPMGTTAIGLAYLFGLPEAARAGYIAPLLDAAVPHGDALRAAIDAAFDELRTTGACLSIGHYQRNAWGIALPVRIGQAGTPMALSCGAIDVAPDIPALRARIAPSLQDAARELEASLREVALTHA